MSIFLKIARLDSRKSSLLGARRSVKKGLSGHTASASFKNRVLDIVKNIPKGKTLSYKDVARIAGNPKASRAVGNILNKNENPKVPCHRVIRSNGITGGFNKGEAEKIKILREEGAIR